MSKKPYPKIALVAGSGTLTSLGIMAFFEFLDKNEIPIENVVGVSGGALACATWASGFDLTKLIDEIPDILSKTKLFTSINYKTALGLLGFPYRFDFKDALLKPDEVLNVYRKIFGKIRLEKLRQKIEILTTDLKTGESVLLNKGYVSDAIYASTALYPFLPPIEIEGRLLVDGGFSSPLPLYALLNKQVDLTIAITVGVPTETKPQSFIDHVLFFLNKVSRNLETSQLELNSMTSNNEFLHLHMSYDKMVHLWDQHLIPDIFSFARKFISQHEKTIFEFIEKKK